ncbi:MAG: hypothetical protein AB7V14_08855 [Kiritimatiellia bacterium]
MKSIRLMMVFGWILAALPVSAGAQTREVITNWTHWGCPGWVLALSPAGGIFVQSGDFVTVTAYITNYHDGYYNGQNFAYPAIYSSWVVTNIPATPQCGDGWTANFEALDDGPGSVIFTVTTPLVQLSRRWKCQQTQTVEKALSVLNMTAYRPTTEEPMYGHPFQRHEVQDDQEECQGAGIRINGDDDDHDGNPDMDNLPVTGENDLIELRLDASLSSDQSDVEYVLKMNSNNLNVWSTQTKDPETEILACFYESPLNVATLVFGRASMTVWVENPFGGTDNIEFIARNKSDGTILDSDMIHFYPFSSVVVLFLGEFDEPTDPPEGGISTLALAAYTNGYDAHLYDEPDLGQPNTENIAFDEIHSAVENRGVTAISLIGFSHGGGTVYRISHRMDADDITYNLTFTAYIDAITQPLLNTSAETRRPTNSAFHVNYYQVARLNDRPLFLDGAPSIPAGAGDEDNVDDPTETERHITIDDAQVVQDGILTRLYQQVNR